MNRDTSYIRLQGLFVKIKMAGKKLIKMIVTHIIFLWKSYSHPGFIFLKVANRSGSFSTNLFVVVYFQLLLGFRPAVIIRICTTPTYTCLCYKFPGEAGELGTSRESGRGRECGEGKEKSTSVSTWQLMNFLSVLLSINVFQIYGFTQKGIIFPIILKPSKILGQKVDIAFRIIKSFG